jgi:hypothetical protein
LKDDDYTARSRTAAADSIMKGHADAENLRELLIWTTAETTAPMIMEYFRQRLHDQQLLANLIEIALEGEDAGDAPWAAANVIAEFPAHLLVVHQADLQRRSQEDWSYLSQPAKRALQRIADEQL